MFFKHQTVYNGTRWSSKRETQQQQRLFPEVMTCLLGIVRTPRLEPFTAGTTFFVYHSARGKRGATQEQA